MLLYLAWNSKNPLLHKANKTLSEMEGEIERERERLRESEREKMR